MRHLQELDPPRTSLRPEPDHQSSGVHFSIGRRRRERTSRVRRRRWLTLQIECDFIDKTPPPVLARLEGPDQGVVGKLMPVCGGMPVRRVVATADVPAMHADTKVDPSTTFAQAVLAPVARRCHVEGRGQVAAGLTHHSAPELGRLTWAGNQRDRRLTSSRPSDLDHQTCNSKLPATVGSSCADGAPPVTGRKHGNVSTHCALERPHRDRCRRTDGHEL